MKKNLLTVVLALVMTIGACFTCFAADAGISADEQKILDSLTAGITLQNGTAVALPEKYMSQAKAYLAKNDLTAEACADVVAKVATVKEDLVATGATSAADLKAKATDSANATKIADAINAAGAAAGVTLNVSLSSGTISYDLKDSTGDVAGSSDKIIKQTGFGFTTTAVAALAVVAVLGGCVVVARKNDLFAQEA